MRAAIDARSYKIARFLLRGGCKLKSEDFSKVSTRQGVQLVHDLKLYDLSQHDIGTSTKYAGAEAMDRMRALGGQKGSPASFSQGSRSCAVPSERQTCAVALCLCSLVVVVCIVIFCG